MHVRRNLSRGMISVTKNGKDRRVDTSTQLAETLGEMLSRRRPTHYPGKWKSQQRNDETRQW
jgi:hypothetical protein